MTQLKRWVAAVLMGIMMIVSACSSDEDARVNRQERRQFYIVMASKLKEIDRGILQLAEKTTYSDSVYADEVERLKDNRSALRSKLDAIDVASNEEWPALRDSVEIFYHGVRSQYADLRDRAPRYEPAAHVDSSTTTTAKGGTR